MEPKRLLLLLTAIILVAIFSYIGIDYFQKNNTVEVPKPEIQTAQEALLMTESIRVLPKEAQEIPVVGELQTDISAYTFYKIEDGELKINPVKENSGTYTLNFLDKENNQVNQYNIKIAPKDKDYTEMEQQIRNYLGSKVDKFGIHFKDLLRDVEVEINADKIFIPASIAKMPVAVLVLRDVDAGKAKLTDTYPIQRDKMFSQTLGNLAAYAEGTQVTLDEYLSNLIRASDNNAWYLLSHYLGWIWEGVNPRTRDELGINPLYLDPPQGTARMVSKLLEDVYEERTLSKSSKDYLLNLMETAGDWARQGVGASLPAGTRFANKIGTLSAGGDQAYEDGAVVWTEDTDYVLTIMNENTSWAEGALLLRDISRIVYDYVAE